MDLAKKLQLKSGQHLAVSGNADAVPAALTGVTVDTEESAARSGDRDTDAGLLVVVSDRVALDLHLEDIAAAASADRLTWVAYPKSGQLGTDLNRDSLAEIVAARGVRPVRQVSVSDVWSALRFRPA
jgi:hypothetical protein